MPLVQLYDPTSEFDRLFEDALAAQLCRGACAPSRESRRHDADRPRMDVHESKDANTVTVTFELPGLTSDGVAIEVHQNRLTVSGEPVVTESGEEKNYVVRERRSGKFSRTLQLPLGTKSEDVKAKMENGVLTITFPKTSEEPAQRIPIQ